ncbi:MAG: hypothetical protein QE271_11540 [Bacteriovoracaceae bacterium]|nr:hypothetical protein [Bacteriovoracaceae bacterium]
MICRKINYFGDFDDKTAGEVFDIVRKVEITGVVTKKSSDCLELLLQGDASMIKLAQHKIERQAKDVITNKEILIMPFQNLEGISFNIL